MLERLVAGAIGTSPRAKRFHKYLAERFTDERDPQVPATNNAAERSLRFLVIGREFSGGTRSGTGSTTMILSLRSYLLDVFKSLTCGELWHSYCA